MRHLFTAACTLAALSLLLLTLSLWQFMWHSADRADQFSLTQGSLRLWVGSPGDFAGFPTQFSTSGWSGDALLWAPEFDRRAKMWVVSNPTGAPNPVARPITGAYLILPMYIPLACFSALSITFGLILLHRRKLARAGRRCATCGYDIRGIGPRCPECGTSTGILRAILQRLIPPTPRRATNATALLP